MKKNKAVFGLFLVLILTAFLCYTAAVGIGPTGTGSVKNIQTGLDLAGGVSITYQTKEKNPSAEDMADTVYKMQRRVEQYSTEAQAYKEGNNRITVEIPGATDADKILSDLGKPGSLCFITQSDTDGNENFSIGEERYVLARSLDEIRRSGSIVLEGSDVADAKGTAYQNRQNGTQYAVSLTLTDEGASKFAEATKENVGKQIAIVYDSQIISAPTVNEAITGGQAQITGMSGIEEAQNLTSYIRIGSLSLELEELRSSVVAAQLGEEAISTSIMAGFIGLIIVILFMLVVYRIPGIVSGIALIDYTLVHILTEPKNSLVKQYQKLFRMDNVTLNFDREALKAIAHKAMEWKTGARGLRSVMEDTMQDIMFEIPSETNIKEYTVTKQMVSEHTSENICDCSKTA